MSRTFHPEARKTPVECSDNQGNASLRQVAGFAERARDRPVISPLCVGAVRSAAPTVDGDVRRASGTVDGGACRRVYDFGQSSEPKVDLPPFPTTIFGLATVSLRL